MIKQTNMPNSSICGREGSWQGSPASCRLITCGAPPHIENTVVELVNGSTSWQSLITYQCRAGYYEAREGRQDTRQSQLQYLQILLRKCSSILSICIRVSGGWTLESGTLEVYI